MFVIDGTPPMTGEIQITSLLLGPADGDVTILPFPLPGDEGLITILPIFDDNFFGVQPLTVDFDFSALTLGKIDLSSLDWTSLLPSELVSTDGFGFQSFVLNDDGGVTLTLLDGSSVLLEPADLAAISFPVTGDAGRLAVDPVTLSGAALDGFSAGWI
ncbi:hypothetical protein [Niveispirillum lacus]|nr:hypothetical protein [Niveispirillum lacus]